MDVALQLALIGLFCGVLLGGAARVTDFCTLGTLETAMLGGDYRRLHIWGVALGTAILGVQIGDSLGIVNRHGTVYHAVLWNPIASISGGLIFGYGMALAGNCGFGAALRAGAGDIRSIILLGVIGVSAYATLAGPLAPIRTALFPQAEQNAPQGMDVTFNALTGLPPALFGMMIGTGLILWGLRHPAVSGSLASAGGAVGVGLAVALSLIGTSFLQNWDVAAVFVEGPSFTAPVGRSILYVMTSTGDVPGYSVGMVFGTMLGAFAICWLRGEFHWEACDDARELGRLLCGAVLMGIGGAVAIGCTIGQGLTATATLAWSGPVTLMAISAGAYVGLQRLVAQPDG